MDLHAEKDISNGHDMALPSFQNSPDLSCAHQIRIHTLAFLKAQIRKINRQVEAFLSTTSADKFYTHTHLHIYTYIRIYIYTHYISEKNKFC